MYSPKIAERLIPPLYRLARARGQHMTTVVNEALAAYLAGQDVKAPAPRAPQAPQPGRARRAADGTRSDARPAPAQRAA
jgi:hypothetical protein